MSPRARGCCLLLALASLPTRWSPAGAAELDVSRSPISGRQEPAPIPLSLVEPILTDEGIKGAAAGIRSTTRPPAASSSTTTRSKERSCRADGDLAAEFKQALAAGERLFVADLREPDLLAIAPARRRRPGRIVFNGRAEDDELRTDQCFQQRLPHRALARR